MCHSATAFSGRARLTFGRWNSQGVPMAYASEHLSLAALELLVHVSQQEKFRDLVAVEAELAIDAKVIARQQSEISKRFGAGLALRSARNTGGG